MLGALIVYVRKDDGIALKEIQKKWMISSKPKPIGRAFLRWKNKPSNSDCGQVWQDSLAFWQKDAQLPSLRVYAAFPYPTNFVVHTMADCFQYFSAQSGSDWAEHSS